MKVRYDKAVDILYIQISESKVEESIESKNGVIIDYDADGKLVGIEVLNASKNTLDPLKMVYEVA
ncbi:DUF2283 domain-containing protein [Aequorivita capsosiphonis]|uniref:DUF2283 domain-containing protein n=1 Tax=Aequorivita capsosiphonis TaxID=487317 RepID=UPI00041A9898|nr:DUF2283 domain-containing protein [Aequorivita capsosiphonis]